MKVNFVTNRPKLFWLIISIAVIALGVGAPAVLLVVLTKSKILHAVVFRGIVLLWVVGFALVIVYWSRQALGKYVGIRARPIREQIW